MTPSPDFDGTCISTGISESGSSRGNTLCMLRSYLHNRHPHRERFGVHSDGDCPRESHKFTSFRDLDLVRQLFFLEEHHATCDMEMQRERQEEGATHRSNEMAAHGLRIDFNEHLDGRGSGGLQLA